MMDLPEPLDLFRQIADPEGEEVSVPPAHAPALVDLALRHRLSPLIARRLAGKLPDASLALLAEEAALVTALTLRLEMLLPDLSARLDAVGARWRIVKGPDFANTLYCDAADRPYSDIDLLVSPEDLGAAGHCLSDLGFAPSERRTERRSARLSEQKWVHSDDPGLMVELHTDLVHYPGLRKRVSFAYQGTDPDGTRDATMRFFVAVVHGLLGHKLHEYRMVIDILQALRAMPAAEREALPDRARKHGLAFETGLATALLHDLYPADGAGKVAASLQTPFTRVAKACLGPRRVLDPSRSLTNRAARHAVRLMQMVVPR